MTEFIYHFYMLPFYLFKYLFPLLIWVSLISVGTYFAKEFIDRNYK